MAEENNTKKKIKIRAFNFKWYEFLIIYGLLNISLFFTINASINNIYENFSKLYVSKLMVDGSDLSIFANMFAAPLFMLLVIVNMGILLLQEFIVILLFRLVYFMSMVKDEEKSKLYRYIKITLLCFILINIIGIIFWGDIKRSIIFIFLHLPIPLFAFILICLKMKKYIKAEALER